MKMAFNARGGTIKPNRFIERWMRLGLIGGVQSPPHLTVGSVNRLLISNNFCDLIANAADFLLSAIGTPASTTDVARFPRFFAFGSKWRYILT